MEDISSVVIENDMLEYRGSSILKALLQLFINEDWKSDVLVKFDEFENGTVCLM